MARGSSGAVAQLGERRNRTAEVRGSNPLGSTNPDRESAPIPDTDAPAAESLRDHRNFVLFWLTRVATTIGAHMQAVAIAWQMYALTDSPFALGLVGLAHFIPAVLLFVIVGHVADRYDRRAILIVCQVIEAVAAALLALGTAKGWLTREGILALVFCFGTARAFESPTMQSLLPGLLPVQLFSRGVAASASASQSAIIAGPALGGFIYALSPVGVYASCVTLFVAAAVLVALISIQRSTVRRDPISFATLFAGIAFIRRRPVILGAISLDLFAVLLGGATALLPVFARDVFAAGPWGLGLLRASPAIGAFAVSLILARWPLSQNVGRVMFAAVATFGVATIVFALSRSFALSMGALIVLGAADMISVVIRQTLVQLQTPDAMRGRVSAVNSLFIGTSNQLGDFEAGLMAALFGTVPAVVLGGIGTLVVVLGWMRLFPALLHADRLEPLRD